MTTDAYQTDAYMTELKEMATQLKIQDSDLHPGGFASDGNLYTEREYVSTIWDETVRVCILRGRGGMGGRITSQPQLEHRTGGRIYRKPHEEGRALLVQR